MATFTFFADAPHKRRADGFNTVVAAGADEAAARASAQRLVGGSIAAFAVTELTDAVPAFGVQGGAPVGARDQEAWSKVTRGGGFLRGA